MIGETGGEMETKRRRKRRTITAFTILAVAILLLTAANIGIGTVGIPLSEIYDAVCGHATEHAAILWNIRMPRTAAALILGGALALSGYLLQTFFHNPIAGPFVLGISSGAKMTVAVVMILWIRYAMRVSSAVLMTAAFVGAMLSMGFVLMIARRVSSMSVLVVCGVMIGYICSAITDFMVTFAEDSDIVNLHGWSQGSFSGMSWSNVHIAAVIVAVAVALTFMLSKPIGAYQLGEAYAQSMGVDIKVFRVTLILLSSILSATVTAFAGPISFVGIAVPHLVKQALNTSRPLVVIPGTFLGGAVFCMLSDLIARTAFAPLELNISTVTSIFGAPVVIAMMLKRQKGK